MHVLHVLAIQKSLEISEVPPQKVRSRHIEKYPLVVFEGVFLREGQRYSQMKLYVIFSSYRTSLTLTLT